MNKKAAKARKAQPAKVKKKQVVIQKAKRPPQAKAKVVMPPVKPTDGAYGPAVHAYEEGLRFLQERKFEKAKALFQKVMAGTSHELADRARVHLNTCLQRLEQAATVFRSHEEHYDYAISLINTGQHELAREHLEKILEQAPKAEFAWYGMAVLDCLTGRVENSLRELTEAIRLNVANRYHARNDSDFNNMADDPRFTELLYPEDEGPEIPSGIRH